MIDDQRLLISTGHGKAHTQQLFVSRLELLRIRLRRRSPGQNGVRERAFGSLKCEHFYRLEIPDGRTPGVEAEHYRQVFNHVRPAVHAMGKIDI